MNKLSYFLVCAMLAACSSAPYYDAKTSSVKVSSHRVDQGDTQIIQQVLNQQYQDWRHVPHRLGGLSKKGIDCSGLVYLTYRKKLGIDLPRSTDAQSKTGKTIKREQLKAGDLVFFKTGLFSRHVGMYLDRGDFLHVSSSKGVRISSLEQPYWRKTYWKAQRVQ